MTSKTARALHPQHALSLNVGGCYIGDDLLNGTAVLIDPWLLYKAGVLQDPNLILMGDIGTAKSSTAYYYLMRQHGVFGRRFWSFGSKRTECEQLARATGAQYVRITSRGDVHLNILDAGGRSHEDVADDRRDALRALIEMQLRRELNPGEPNLLAAAIAQAARERDEPTARDVCEALFNPGGEFVEKLRGMEEWIRSDARPLALVLQDLCDGPWGNIIAGQSNVNLDADAVVIDLSALRNTDGLKIALTIGNARLRNSLNRDGAANMIVCVDEAWHMLEDFATAKFMHGNWKLARELGVHNIAILHHVDDTEIGGPGSRHATLVRDLLSHSGTKVLHRQSPAVLERTRLALGMSHDDVAGLSHLKVGQARWFIGDLHPTDVQHRRTEREAKLIYTDEAMLRGAA